MSRYPRAQWFDPPRRCQVCGKPAGTLMSDRNEVLTYMCEAHAKKEIKAAHRFGKFLPDYAIARPATPESSHE